MSTKETETGAGGEHVGPLLDAYRTDELDAAARAAVAAHLEACARCREDLAALGPWTAAIERGYAALREESRELSPDWAAQRAAVVGRTSARR
ncbi:MAG TPA: zf-HC2 domain-containing protein, partial [Gemmatimonadota bacterium]|nr:zf-HC2 domain-containing protein [Gemmatimonadota bacterium]